MQDIGGQEIADHGSGNARISGGITHLLHQHDAMQEIATGAAIGFGDVSAENAEPAGLYLELLVNRAVLHPVIDIWLYGFLEEAADGGAELLMFLAKQATIIAVFHVLAGPLAALSKGASITSPSRQYCLAFLMPF